MHQQTGIAREGEISVPQIMVRDMLEVEGDGRRMTQHQVRVSDGENSPLLPARSSCQSLVLIHTHALVLLELHSSSKLLFFFFEISFIVFFICFVFV